MTHGNGEQSPQPSTPTPQPAVSPADQAAHDLAGCRTRPSAGGPLDYTRRDVRRTMSRVLGR